MPLMIHKKYPSKVLLFGEYSVLLGGQALAVPFPAYSGQWVNGVSPENRFCTFCNYLEKIQAGLKSPLQLQSINEFLANGAYFESSIPMGVGLGSSAALTASIYDRFSDHSLLDIKDKMLDLALVESYFHGKSSGFDALVSLMHTPILMKKGEIKLLVNRPQSSVSCYLLFTKQIRETQGLVDWFRKERLRTGFEREMQLISSISDQCIDYFIADHPDLFEKVRMLSKIQYNVLNRLVVPEIQDLWASSFDSDDYAIKLCGAGGGGCYLVMAPEPLKQKTLGGFPIQPF